MLESTIAIGSYVILFVFSYLSFTEYLFRNYENSKSVTFTFALTLASSLSMLQLLVFEISGGLSLNMKWTLWRVHLGILIVDLVFILPIPQTFCKILMLTHLQNKIQNYILH